MNCTEVQEQLEKFLGGDVLDHERQRFEMHLETCESCQSTSIVGADLGRLLRDKLPVPPANPALRARILDALPPVATPVSVGVRRASADSLPWYQRLLASRRTPQLAMVAVLALLLLVPLRTVFRAPALAQVAVERHECHAGGTAQVLPACCDELQVAIGAPLGAPSEGAVVPDLRAQGLELQRATRCTFKGQVVTILAYGSVDSESFSLYITDRLTEEFTQLRRRESNGLVQASHEVRDSKVTIWEQDGLVYFWVGEPRSEDYAVALDGLQAR